MTGPQPERIGDGKSSPRLYQITRVRETNEWLPEGALVTELLQAAAPDAAADGSYYGVPMLKRPLWRWHIALYFFLEGVSAGSFIIASLADLVGGGRFRKLSRAGYYASLLAIIPCPPLLIADLGVPGRFHHMLRIFKPSSPMNLGAWSLAAYGIPLQMIALRHLADDTNFLPRRIRRLLLRLVPERLAGILGIPSGLLMIAYPGVLLSNTSNPAWSQTRLLGALFSSSSIATGAAATQLALALAGGDANSARARVERIERAASLCEGAALAGYLCSPGPATSLLKGRYLWHMLLAGAAVTSHLLPAPQPEKRHKRGLVSLLVRSALTLAGGMALKWAITYAGRKSAADPRAAERASRPSRSAPGWGSGTSPADPAYGAR